MDEKKFIDIQKQMRENQSEMLDYVSDLDKWLTDINKKEKTGQQSNNSCEKALPPVRNSLLQKKKKKEPKPESKKSTSRIKAYDYAAWDKFDVDKALEDEENAESKNHKPSEEEGETDEEWEDERRRLLAEEEKKTGNLMFKEGRMSEAVEHYTRALQLDPVSAILYCNRAMCHLKEGRFAAALDDCNSALVYDPKNVKALYRRALAHSNLNQLEEAVKDLETCIQLEPSNMTAQRECDKLRAQLNPTGIVQPVKKAPHERSKKPLVRVAIHEVGEEPLATPSSKPLLEEISLKPAAPPAAPPPKAIVTELSQEESFVAPPAPKPATVKKPAPTPTMTYSTAVLDLDALPYKNSTQFLQSLRRVSQSTVKSSLRAQFIAQIAPTNYPGLFQQNVEAEHLVNCMTCLADALEEKVLQPQVILEATAHLARLPRFKSAWMFASKGEKEAVHRLFTNLETHVNVPEELRRTFT